MGFDLQHGRLDLRIRHQIMEQPGVVVTHTDLLDQPRADQLFHRAPGLRERHRVGHHHGVLGSGVGDPLRRVAGVKVDVLERNREVNEIQVQLAQAEVL